MRNSQARPPTFLFDLMPIVDRRRDLSDGDGTLRALLAVAQSVFELLEDDMGALYDNWFVETCEPAILPYIADLVGIPRALSIDRPAADLRRLVANVVDYRRRKGTPDALAEIASDVSGWTVRVAEAAATLGRAPNVAVWAPQTPHWVALRDPVATTELGGPFDANAHTIDVRTSGARGARAAGNLGTLALFAWRAIPSTLSGVDAHHHGAHRYTFDPLGDDARLINPPAYEGAPERLVPAPLRNARLRDEVLPNARPVFLDSNDPAFAIEVVGAKGRRRLTSRELLFTDLRRWSHPRRNYALVDVERGRFVLDPAWESPRVDATWSSAGAVGGGAYRQRDAGLRRAHRELLVAREPIDGVPSYDSLEAAFGALSTLTDPVRIVLTDSATYAAPPGGWTLPVHQVDRVALVAAPGVRPLLNGSLRVHVAVAGARVRLDSVLLNGSLRIDAQDGADDVRLTIADATIVPGGRVALDAATALNGTIRLRRTICGRIRLPDLGTTLHAAESVIDGRGEAAIAGHRDAGPETRLERCTVFGDVDVFAAEIDESIVTGAVAVRAGDASSVRHTIVVHAEGIERRDAVDDDVPRFVSRRYGAAGYAQLRLDDGRFALSGARDGGELGAFHAVSTGRRLANLQLILEEYVPYGVRPGVVDEG